jgi:hypothetical protein
MTGHLSILRGAVNLLSVAFRVLINPKIVIIIRKENFNLENHMNSPKSVDRD